MLKGHVMQNAAQLSCGTKKTSLGCYHNSSLAMESKVVTTLLTSTGAVLWGKESLGGSLERPRCFLHG
jgi:hypothetical protein